MGSHLNKQSSDIQISMYLKSLHWVERRKKKRSMFAHVSSLHETKSSTPEIRFFNVSLMGYACDITHKLTLKMSRKMLV